MKLIKTTARDSMADSRLNDLFLLAIETDFTIDFEQIIDIFVTQYKNSRTMLE